MNHIKHALRLWNLLPTWAKAVDIILACLLIYCLSGIPARAEDHPASTNHVDQATSTNQIQHVEYRLNLQGVDAFPKGEKSDKKDKPFKKTKLNNITVKVKPGGLNFSGCKCKSVKTTPYHPCPYNPTPYVPQPYQPQPKSPEPIQPEREKK